jgi:hypothetical protein
MNRTIPILLLLLLVSSVGFAVYQYSENQRLAVENATLKQQLDSTAERLRQAEDENKRVSDELNQTQTQVAELNAKIDKLEQNITQLRKELKLRDYTTLGLTFLWTPKLGVDAHYLRTVVDIMNKIPLWEEVGIYFFLYHAEPADFVPYTDFCLQGALPTWGKTAWNLYPERDIPVGIVWSVGTKYAGCANIPDSHNNALRFIVLGYQAMFWQRGGASDLLAHEILHIFGLSEEQDHVYLIDTKLYPKICSSAEWFQMPLPVDYEF